MRCDDPLRGELSAFVAGDLDDERSAIVLAHVEHCPTCSEELDLLADLLVAIEEELGPRSGAAPAPAAPSPAPPVPSVFGRPVLRWVAAAAAVVALAFVARELVASGRTDPRSLAELSPPSYAASARRAPDTLLARALEEAMVPYRAGDLAGARSALERFLLEHTDHRPARFYLSALDAADGDFEQARAGFEAVAAGRDDYLAEHALWRLANVELAGGGTAEAAETLRRLAVMDGAFAPNARALLEQLDLVPEPAG